MLCGRNRGLLLLLALSFVLLAGCVTPSNRATSLASDQTTVAPPLPEVDDHLVQAYAHYAQGMIYDMDEQPDLALDELAKAAAEDPSNTDLVLDLSRRYLQQKQLDRAQDLLTRATAVPGASGVLFARLAMVDSALDKGPQAVDACATAIKRSPDSIEGYRILFFIQLQKGQHKDALKTLQQAAKVPDTSAEFDLDLVELFVTLEHQAPAETVSAGKTPLEVLHRAAALQPDNAQLRMKLGDSYSALGDITNATQVYLDLVDAYNDLPAARAVVHDKLARIYLREKDYTNATVQLKAIVQDDPANAQAYYLLGSLADDQRQLPEAVDYFQKTLILSEDFEEAYYDLARVQIDINDPKAALETLAKAHTKFQLGFVPEVLTALAYEKQKDFTNAINHFTSAEVIAKASDPKRLNSGFYFDQGAAYERGGDYEEAERCFQKSLELSPDSAEALNYLGYMWADRGVKLEKAHDLIEKAVKLEPKSPAYLDSLGWVLYKLNRPQEALPQLQKAIELSDEPDPTLYDHLGDIYALLKQTDKAREAWTKSLSLDPNTEVRKKLNDVVSKPSQ
jgi:tetratricopeptide (TPR) repeat protein